MSKTKIEWTDRVWNPVRGCSRVSQGCRNCYAERQAARFSDFSEPFAGFAQRTNAGPRWTGRVDLLEDKLTEPLRWRRWAERFRREHGRRPRCFVNSMSDLFHEAVTDEAIDRVFAVMALCPDVTFQVLTKRAGRMREWIDQRSGDTEPLQVAIESLGKAGHEIPAYLKPVRCAQSHSHMTTGVYLGREEWIETEPPWPLPNVWLGVSVENQPTADERIPELLATPAAVRGVSYEPALGPVDFRRWLYCPDCGYSRADARLHADHRLCGDSLVALDWIIAGGESGPGARPAHPDWFRAVREQCKAADVPFFMKQITERGRKVAFEEWPQDLRVREFPNAR